MLPENIGKNLPLSLRHCFDRGACSADPSASSAISENKKINFEHKHKNFY